MMQEINPEVYLVKRIRNQIRIHWSWLRKQHSVDMADFIEAIIKDWYEDKTGDKNE